jgi:hypothetical protein
VNWDAVDSKTVFFRSSIRWWIIVNWDAVDSKTVFFRSSIRWWIIFKVLQDTTPKVPSSIYARGKITARNGANSWSRDL